MREVLPRQRPTSLVLEDPGGGQRVLADALLLAHGHAGLGQEPVQVQGDAVRPGALRQRQGGLQDLGALQVAFGGLQRRAQRQQ